MALVVGGKLGERFWPTAEEVKSSWSNVLAPEEEGKTYVGPNIDWGNVVNALSQTLGMIDPIGMDPMAAFFIPSKVGTARQVLRTKKAIEDANKFKLIGAATPDIGVELVNYIKKPEAARFVGKKALIGQPTARNVMHEILHPTVERSQPLKEFGRSFFEANPSIAPFLRDRQYKYWDMPQEAIARLGEDLIDKPGWFRRLFSEPSLPKDIDPKWIDQLERILVNPENLTDIKALTGGPKSRFKDATPGSLFAEEVKGRVIQRPGKGGKVGSRVVGKPMQVPTTPVESNPFGGWRLEIDPKTGEKKWIDPGLWKKEIFGKEDIKYRRDLPKVGKPTQVPKSVITISSDAMPELKGKKIGDTVDLKFGGGKVVKGKIVGTGKYDEHKLIEYQGW